MCKGSSGLRGSSGSSSCLCEELHLALRLCQCVCLLRVGCSCVLCMLLRMLQCCLGCSQLLTCMHTCCKRLPLFGLARYNSDKVTLQEDHSQQHEERQGGRSSGVERDTLPLNNDHRPCRQTLQLNFSAISCSVTKTQSCQPSSYSCNPFRLNSKSAVMKSKSKS